MPKVTRIALALLVLPAFTAVANVHKIPLDPGLWRMTITNAGGPTSTAQKSAVYKSAFSNLHSAQIQHLMKAMNPQGTSFFKSVFPQLHSQKSQAAAKAAPPAPSSAKSASITYKYCITQTELTLADYTAEFGNESWKCHVAQNSSPAETYFSMSGKCVSDKGRKAKGSGTLQVVDRRHFKGNAKLKLTDPSMSDAVIVNSKSNYTAKWLGPICTAPN